MNLNYGVNMSDIHILINLIKIFDAFINDLESINPYNTTNQEQKKQTQVEPNPNAEMNKDGEEKQKKMKKTQRLLQWKTLNIGNKLKECLFLL